VRKSPRARGLSGSIHIHHHIVLIATIPQSARAGKGRGSLQQIREKLDAQRLDCFLIQSSKKAGKGRTRGKAVAMKERRNIVAKRSKTIIKGFQSRFPTERIAHQHDDKIDGIIRSKAGSGKLHLLFNG
jgi:hypothetical protein